MKTSKSEVILLDTNVLIYAHDKQSPSHKIASKIRKNAINGGLKAAIAIQNLLEFFSVTTNPKRVKNPFSFEEASSIINDYLYSGKLKVIIPTVETIFTFSRLLAKYEKDIHSGPHIFDLFLAATVISAGINTIFTKNCDDFAFIEELNASNPFEDE